MTGWTLNASDIISNAQTIFNALAPVAAVAIGISLGPRILRAVSRMFRS